MAQLLAKSGGDTGAPETLLHHSLLVVQTARRLFSQLPAPVADPALLHDLEIAAAIHDVGKAATGFQDMLSGKRRNWNGWRHEFLSAGLAAAAGFPDEAIFAVLTHHRRIPGLHTLDDGHLRFRREIPEDWSGMLEEFDRNRGEFASFWVELCEQLGWPNLAYLAASPLRDDFLAPAWRRSDRQVTALLPSDQLSCLTMLCNSVES